MANRSGDFITQPGGFRAFYPSPLPPDPPVKLDDGGLRTLLSEADLALGRLDGRTGLLPNPDFFVGMYVRREAVLSSQVEGTQASLTDLLQFEAGEALETLALPESDLGKAIAYMSSLWHGLVVFLDDPRVPLDNNATERGIRGLVVGRKNHYGSKSRRGTEVAALYCTVFETAKLAGIDPKAYLRRAVHGVLIVERVQLPHELATAAAA